MKNEKLSQNGVSYFLIGKILGTNSKKRCQKYLKILESSLTKEEIWLAKSTYLKTLEVNSDE